MILVIAEKPSVAQTIAAVLEGKGERKTDFSQEAAISFLGVWDIW